MNDLMHQTAGATPLDPDELAGLRHRHVQTHAELNQLEQVNIQIGQKWLAKQKDPPLLTEHFIREFHRRMLGEVWQWAGQFRQTEKNVGIDPRQIGIEIRNLHDDTGYWIEHMVFEPLEIAARYHHRMLQIHPFPNGNGRHSRLMTDELLKSLDLPALDWTHGKTEAQMPEHRKRYIRALWAADGHDFSELLSFMCSNPQ